MMAPSTVLIVRTSARPPLTFWERRERPGVALFHSSDLLADLPGQLRGRHNRCAPRATELKHIDIVNFEVYSFSGMAAGSGAANRRLTKRGSP